MIKEQAVVIASDAVIGGQVSVRVDRKSACESCQMKAGCGQKLVGESSQRTCIEFDLNNELNAKVGDRVTLAIPESSFLQASAVMYILPLLLMIVCAAIADRYFQLSDGGIFAFSALGFGGGLYCARRFAQRRKADPDFQPLMVAIERDAEDLSS